MALTRSQMDSVVKAEFARAAKGKPPLFQKAKARLAAKPKASNVPPHPQQPATAPDRANRPV